MDFNQLMQDIGSCYSMRIADGGELVTMEVLKGKHIFAATRYMGQNPGTDFTQALISVTAKVDGKAYTIAELYELPGYLAFMLLEMITQQFPGASGEMCNR